MVNPQVGFQPRTTPAERRADFDTQRRHNTAVVDVDARLTALETADTALDTRLDTLEARYNAVCQVRMSTPQSLTSGSFATLNFDTEDFDPLGWHDNVTNNSRITPTIAGWYEVYITASLPSDTDYTRCDIGVQKNATNLSPPAAVSLLLVNSGSHTPVGGGTVGLVSMNGTTDYLNLSGVQVNTSANANAMNATFTVRWIRPT